MSKIFITGSSDGLGLLSAQALAKRGHAVYLHARNDSRAQDARRGCPEAKDVLVADLASADETKRLASQLNEKGPWDAIIHNAGIMTRRPGAAAGGGNEMFAVNTLAPYMLTCLVDPPPKRYVFLSSSMHQGGDASLRDVEGSGYGDTKLHNIMLAKWFARHLNNGGQGKVDCSSTDPGWVPTKMGGAGAPDDIEKSVATYVLLTEGTAPAVKEAGSGQYWRDSRVKAPKAGAGDEAAQNRLVELLKGVSGVSPPA
ncbi:hypothetical protein PG994_005015 [Apiospora phragmitis]|uniref:Uncharacterized protein n=1 Tax=Apiospora phragmitis TaxID=2905665 RepID=A0ABR1VS69_9PEZI